MHLLGVATTLPEADGEGQGEREQGEDYDDQNTIRSEGVACGRIETELGDVEGDEGCGDNPDAPGHLVVTNFLVTQHETAELAAALACGSATTATT